MLNEQDACLEKAVAGLLERRLRLYGEIKRIEHLLFTLSKQYGINCDLELRANSTEEGVSSLQLRTLVDLLERFGNGHDLG
jgi:hypothetical protein